MKSMSVFYLQSDFRLILSSAKPGVVMVINSLWVENNSRRLISTKFMALILAPWDIFSPALYGAKGTSSINTQVGHASINVYLNHLFNLWLIYSQ
jgi:hypothetical protein